MKILLRKTDEGKIIALDPEDGIALTLINEPSVWADSGSNKTCYGHANGIYWDSMESAMENLKDHFVVTD